MKFWEKIAAAICVAIAVVPIGVMAFAGDSEPVKIQLNDEVILVDEKEISKSSSDRVYAGEEIVYYKSGTDAAYGEGTEADMHTEAEAREHTVVTITKPGTYEISGKLSKGQIAVDLGENAKKDKNSTVTLVLNNADITCTVAPAVIFYNVYECGNTETASAVVDTSSAGAKVVIADGSVNNINGSYVARIYKEGTTKKLHKYDGAFYSKMSMEIDGGEKGDGVLKINAENEGLDSELHLTINGGNIFIKSGDDGINTNEDGISVTTINGGYLNIFAGEGAEGDGIDSNGFISINGGTVISLANPKSMDGGIDSDMGTYINGGTVVGAGRMYDEVEKTSNQSFMVLEFTDETDSLITVTDAEDKAVFAYDFPYSYTYIVFSTPELADGTYHVYSGGSVTGKETDGLFTDITGYEKGTQLHHGGERSGRGPGGMPMPPDGERPEFAGEPPQMPEGMNRPDGAPERPDGRKPEGMAASSETETYDFNLSADTRTFTGVSGNKAEKQPEPSGKFSDVNAGDWYFDAVEYVSSKGIMNGMSANTFEPDTDVSRAMMIQILYKLSGEKSDGKAGFSDVAEGMWYSEAAAWAEKNKIASGYSDGTFRPDSKVTREEIAAFIYRYTDGLASPTGDIEGFDDADEISGYAKASVQWCIENGLISGMGNNKIEPGATASRAQLASIIMRFMGASPNNLTN